MNPEDYADIIYEKAMGEGIAKAKFVSFLSREKGNLRRTKDEHAEGPLRGFPFVQEIQDVDIPSHFCLPMLEVYDDSSDPTEHKEEEHLEQYLARFTDEVRAIPDAHPSLVIQAFMIGIRPSCLFWSLVERPSVIVSEMLQRANQYVTVETLVAEKREDQKRH
ncbi:hypothetical protein B296_00014988 [Ensete ventricosum]|uniref:Uncharacterized protein n=1 Tax=Ensete ventricosum TaxID=4639 RepID=A0A427B240_ENSVE|nr:hypothetical protein B296_00014988 [Ensete ventricosum]